MGSLHVVVPFVGGSRRPPYTEGIEDVVQATRS